MQRKKSSFIKSEKSLHVLRRVMRGEREKSKKTKKLETPSRREAWID
jgi:hypothetical protein